MEIKMNFGLKMQIFIWGTGLAIVAGIASSPAANADGLNPNLIRDATAVCTALETGHDVGVVIKRYGMAYASELVNQVCPVFNSALTR